MHEAPPATSPDSGSVSRFGAVSGVRRRFAAMSFSSDDIARLARLARIRLDAAETNDVREKLDAIFSLIDTLQAIDTRGVAPMAHAQDVMLPLRDDVVTAEECR